MKKGLIGKKVGMTQIFDEKGMIIPVTVIEAGPCVVSQVKTVETDGYNAVQLGFGEVKAHKVNKPYILGKFLQGIISAFLTFLLFHFLPFLSLDLSNIVNVFEYL